MRRTATLLIVASLLLVSCGDSGTDDEPPHADPTTTTSSTSTATPTSSAPTTTAEPEPEPTVEAPELAGTSWIVTDYRLPNGSITNVWKTEVTIAFAADGSVSGSAGCNDYQGSWAVTGDWDEFEPGVPDPNDGQKLTLSDLAWTERACENDAIMEQETEILDLLQSAGRWVLIRDAFHLRDAEGTFLFEAKAA